MRIALVVPPPNRINAKVRAGIFDALRERLERGGARVIMIPTSKDLAAELDRATASLTADDAVLVYVAGATTLHEDGSLALRLETDGELALGFQALRAPLRTRGTREALFVIDIVHDGFADDVMRATEHVEAAARATAAGADATSMLVGASAQAGVAGETMGDEALPWPLTRLFLEALDEPTLRDERAEIHVKRVAEWILDVPNVDDLITGLAYVEGANAFVLDAVVTNSPSGRPSGGVGAPSLPPAAMPALEPLLGAADAARDRRAWDEALETYKKALMVVGPADAAAKASIYASIAEVKREQGKLREAEMNFEKALGALPGHRRSLDALIALATDAKDFKRVVDYRRLIVSSRQDPRRKAEELCTIATLLESELEDGRGAATALEEARELAPRDLNVLQRLRAVYESTQSFSKLVDLLGALCLEGSAPVARAELRFVQADVTLGRLRDEPRGLSLLEAALEEDPAHERSLAALVAVRTRRQEWKELARTYERVADLCAHEGLTERAWDLCKRLGAVRRDRLRDGPGAIEAYRGALVCKPRDADTRAMLAELLLTQGDAQAALGELERASTHVPTRSATYRRLFEIHTRAGRTDRAWLAAVALDELGAAEVDHDLLIDQFRPEGSLHASAALDDTAWTRLTARGVDARVSAVLRAIAPVAIGFKCEELQAKKTLTSLDPKRKQGQTSTVSIVRTFVFASQVLGITLPDLYVLDEVPGGLAAVQLETQTTAIGPSVLRGMSVPTLAFLVARHLTYYRPEHYALVFFPTLSELQTLVLSAIKIALPEMPVSKQIAEGAKRLEKGLARQGKDGKKALCAAVEALDAQGGRFDLGSWIRGVELTAHRAGLLLSCELAVAMKQIRGESRAIAALTLEDKRGDLLAFCASPEFAALRAELGIGAAAST